MNTILRKKRQRLVNLSIVISTRKRTESSKTFNHSIHNVVSRGDNMAKVILSLYFIGFVRFPWSIVLKCTAYIFLYMGGRMAEWLGRRSSNPEVAGSNPALNIQLELFLGIPLFTASVMLVNSQLFCLPPSEIFKPNDNVSLRVAFPPPRRKTFYFYFSLILLPSCYRTVCYRTVCFWTVC